MEFQKEAHRIFAEDTAGKLLAELVFPETEPGVFTIQHTFADASLKGQGVAARLVDMAVEEIQARGGEVRATCSYAAGRLNQKASLGTACTLDYTKKRESKA